MHETKKLITSDSEQTFIHFYKEKYFYSKINKEEAINMLKGKPKGTYLFRNSDNEIGVICSFVDPYQSVSHYEIKQKDIIIFPTPNAVINILLKTNPLPFVPFNQIAIKTVKNQNKKELNLFSNKTLLTPEFVCDFLTTYLNELTKNHKVKKDLIEKFKNDHNVFKVVWNIQNLSKYSISLKRVNDINASLLFTHKLKKTETIKYTVTLKEVDHFLAVILHEDRKTADIILDTFIRNKKFPTTTDIDVDTKPISTSIKSGFR